MKMVMAVIPKQEASDVIAALVEEGLTATFMDSRGGVLRHASQTLFVAIEDSELEKVVNIIGRSCHACVSLERAPQQGQAAQPSERRVAQVGGAVVFVWDLQASLKL